jgi:hypothetical protein
LTGPGETVAVAGIGGATGRTERTVSAMAAFDCVNRVHPVNVLPLHNSQALPGGIRILLTTSASIERVGPEIVMLKPLKWPWLNKTASSFD